jgi:flagellar hook-associated protein 3 FlgL
MQNQQTKLARLQEQLASGQKILKPSDDPAAAARTLELEQVAARTEQYQDNITAADMRLQLQDTTLADVTNLLQRARDLAIQANNGVLNDESRQAIAAELQERRNELLSLGNTIDANGDFLFAGFKGSTQPFQTNSVGEFSFVDYQGDQGKRFVQVSQSRQVQEGEPGSEIFMKVPAAAGLTTRKEGVHAGNGTAAPAFVFDPTVPRGNTYRIEFTDATTFDIFKDGAPFDGGRAYTSGELIPFDGIRTAIEGAPAAGDSFTISSSRHQDIFTTLDKFIATLEMPVASDDDKQLVTAGLGQAIGDLDGALGRVTEFRTRVGGRLNALDSQRDENDAFHLQTQTALSRIRDLDYAEAVSQFQLEMFTLQAAQQTFAKLEGMSLFNFLR